MRALGEVLRVAWPLRWRLLLAALLGVGTVAGGIGLMATAAYLIATAALRPSIAELQVAIVGVRFFGVARSALRYAERLVSHAVSLRLLERLRVWLVSSLEPLLPARAVGLPSGDLLARAVADVESLRDLYVRGLAPPLVALLVGVSAVALVGRAQAVLGGSLALFLLLGGLATPLVGGRLAAAPGRRLTDRRAELVRAVVETGDALPELVAFRRAGDQRRTVDRLGIELERERARLALAAGLDAAVEVLTSHGAVWCLLLLAIPLVRAGSLDGVALAVLALFALASFEAVLPLPAAARALGGQLRAAERLVELVEARPTVSEPDRPAAAPGGRPLTLTLREVSFTYPGEPEPALRDLTFAVPAGGWVAVLGSSGAGKSTLAHLLLRVFDPDSGCVEVGGCDLRELGQEDLRRLVGVVSQRTRLFAGSIRSNLLLGRPDADDAALWSALVAARLDREVAGLPQGLETEIGALGHALSGGQRQRLAVARTLLRDPPLLVLDEPAANLDPVTERSLLASLMGQASGRTTVLFTHRLVGLEQATSLLVLDRGRIVERGTHAELLRAASSYRRQWQAQRLLG